jgi:hypothetical protein
VKEAETSTYLVLNSVSKYYKQSEDAGIVSVYLFTPGLTTVQRGGSYAETIFVRIRAAIRRVILMIVGFMGGNFCSRYF